MAIHLLETCLIVLLLGCQGTAQINPTPTREQLRATWQKDPSTVDRPYLLVWCGLFVPHVGYSSRLAVDQ